MSSIFARGPKSAPRWYARWKDAAGAWRSRRVHQETKKEALAIARQLEAQAERRAYGIEPSAQIWALMGRWSGGLANRAAKSDQLRIAKHLIPKFGDMRLSDLTVAVVVLWLDDLAAAGKLKPSSQRGLLGLLSRFCSWCVDRGFMATNPCKAIPGGRRPHGARGGADVPWIADDATVLRVMELLPEPIRFLFFLGNRCGLRTGEACGISLSDFDDIDKGIIRIRWQYNRRPLKEDKRGTGKVKWAPAPVDLGEVLGPWLERRRTEGAGPDDLAFPAHDGRFPFNKDQVGAWWHKIREAAGLATMTWFQATRHSFASRKLAEGASMDEVSDALGHSSTRSTETTYVHFKRRSFSPALRAPLPKKKEEN